MATQFLFEAPLGLLPVSVFLATLLYFDSYRLITLNEVVQTVGAGLLIAIASYFANGALIQLLRIDYSTYSHFVGPVVEECLKSVALIWLFFRNRIGFMIDAAIMGFAVGTGFALFENVYYLYMFQGANIGVWIIRGFGTAIMHGGAVAIFATLSQSLIERRGALKPIYLVPGLLLAIVIHTIYNQLETMPLIATVALLVGLPPLFLLIFTRSEYAVHQWLVKDYESHEHLLEEINSGEFVHSEAGRFIVNLSAKFSKAVVDDIFSYLKLHTQLVLRAEQITLARERNERYVAQASDKEDLHRLDELERRIGPVAMMAIWPHLHFSRRELWEIHELHNESLGAHQSRT
jgi:RsiW-degrading membrane proteinase PrsW (M82 family)